MNKIVIFGSAGYLGKFYINQLLDKQIFNFSAIVEKISLKDLDVKKCIDRNFESVLYFSTKLQSNKNDKDFYDVNVNIPIKLSEISKHFVYLSSDYALAEDIENEYSKSKKEAEQLLKQKNNTCILRTSSIYGYKSKKRKSFFSLLQDFYEDDSRKVLKVYKDSYIKPTFIDDLCNCIDFIVDKKLVGCYNGVGREYISRYDFAKKYLYEIAKEIITIENDKNDTQNFIEIECSGILKQFFLTGIDDGIKRHKERVL